MIARVHAYFVHTRINIVRMTPRMDMLMWQQDRMYINELYMY